MFMSLVCEAHETCQCICKCKVCSKHVHVYKRIITAHNAGITAGYLQLQISGIVLEYTANVWEYVHQ